MKKTQMQLKTLQIHHVPNTTIHDEDNSSEAEDDTSDENSVNKIETYGNNGEQNEQENKLLMSNFEVKVENRNVEGLIANLSV